MSDLETSDLVVNNAPPAGPRPVARVAADTAPMQSPMFIAGEEVFSATSLDVFSPYDGAHVGAAAMANEGDVLVAIGLMQSAPKLSRHRRATILRGMSALVATHLQELATLASRESGLSLKDTRHEMSRAIDSLSLAADATTFDDGAAFAGDIGANGKSRRILSHREPVGLIGAITPFNHPVNQVVAKLAPAIAAGAPIIIKPSEKTPLSALAMGRIAFEAGLPGEMLSILPGRPEVIAGIFATHPAIKMVSFTGSPRVGKLLLAQAHYRRVVMELGGNDPLIVFPDADLGRAATLAVAGAFANSGQRCTAVKRILVAESVADAFVEALAEKTRALRQGDPLDPSTDIGTVIDEAAAIQIESRWNAAVASGARVIVPLRRQGALVSPCVLDHVPTNAALVREETFGPVAPVMRFRSLDEA
ncbi:MAG: aldehyde dehydrogenase family protein, partial [Bosea sp. (in: a-proteobacteria)]